MTTTTKFNGQTVKSINFTESTTEANHTTTLLINAHVIKGQSKGDCIEMAAELKVDTAYRNDVEWFAAI